MLRQRYVYQCSPFSGGESPLMGSVEAASRTSTEGSAAAYLLLITAYFVIFCFETTKMILTRFFFPQTSNTRILCMNDEQWIMNLKLLRSVKPAEHHGTPHMKKKIWKSTADVLAGSFTTQFLWMRSLFLKINASIKQHVS